MLGKENGRANQHSSIHTMNGYIYIYKGGLNTHGEDKQWSPYYTSSTSNNIHPDRFVIIAIIEDGRCNGALDL